jgi:hypothetical protein
MEQKPPIGVSGGSVSYKGPPDNRKIDRGRTYKCTDSGHVEVYDLDTAAWLLMKGVPVAEARKLNHREIIVVFYDKDNRIPQLVIDFLNSESNTFANAIRSLKKACWSSERQR